jgi:hypothetical protein
MKRSKKYPFKDDAKTFRKVFGVPMSDMKLKYNPCLREDIFTLDYYKMWDLVAKKVSEHTEDDLHKIFLKPFEDCNLFEAIRYLYGINISLLIDSYIFGGWWRVKKTGAN